MNTIQSNRPDMAWESITTVVFDLDGTLLETLEDLADSVNYVLKSHQYPQRSLEEIRSFVGNGVSQLIHLALPNGNDPIFHACLSEFREYYSLHMQDKTAPYPGITELLHTLSHKNYALAIVSNKFDDAVKALNQSYFGTFISVAVGDSSSTRRKPAPDSIWKALKKLNAEKQNAIYVGDSEVDIETAKNAGIPCISVTWGFRSKDELIAAGADHIIHHPMELYHLLNSH